MIFIQGLRILAFPCNQFMHQEPGTVLTFFFLPVDEYIYHYIILKIGSFSTYLFIFSITGTSEEIKCFIAGYKGNGKFDTFSKISVNGDDAHPLWKFLKEKQGGLVFEYVCF